ncbi:Phosphoserine phosphatase RsbU [Thalassoglobus neptunius]|uniref:Phosphoserine phosphatase RsbU n=1 Tax=Thalassoglobus neptunius TaxID=1938619 RepID=A0A5C5WGX8_9PLAN|nr:SpoIIE family protein phosphatase [Thalassoglobus neptunius]TWT50036.1 Phosphoserine phosphatase RsbU [Thalassoglobus neptunius]
MTGNRNPLTPSDVEAENRQPSSKASAPDSQSTEVETDQRVQTLMSYSPEAIVILDAETGRFIEVNPMAVELFGYDRDELLQFGPFDLSPPFQPTGRSEVIGARQIQLAVQGETPIFEWWHRNANGERIPCEVRLVRMPWGGRDVLRASILDMRERKILQVSEYARRRLLDNITQGTPLPDALSALIQSVENLLPGMKCAIFEKVIGVNRLELLAAPNLPELNVKEFEETDYGQHLLQSVDSNPHSFRVSAENIGAHPAWTALAGWANRTGMKSCWSRPVMSFSGDVGGVFSMFYDQQSHPAPVELEVLEVASQLAAIAIDHDQSEKLQREVYRTLRQRVAEETEHLSQANDKLRKTREDLRIAAVAFDTHDSIVITDRSGTILRVNDSFTALTGYSHEEVVGQTPRLLRSGRHDDKFYQEMWKAISEVGYWEGRIWNRRKDGTEYLQRLTITSLKDDTGKITHYVGDGQDITDEVKASADRAEIDAARTVQQSLFPATSPAVQSFDIAGRVFPAERVSGDFFDFIPIDEETLGVVVADVSGHGLGPSLVMAQTQAYLRALVEPDFTPGSVLTHANQLYIANNSGHFVTILLGRLHHRKQTFLHAGAGHRGFLLRENGDIETLGSTGLPLGITHDSRIESAEEKKLLPGDLILLPTDGIEESYTPEKGELFGHERLIDLALKHRHRPADEIVTEVHRAAREFVSQSPQCDDITLVVIKATDFSR